MTRLVLVNAVYFKGPWLYPFNKESTSDRSFFTDETNKVEVPFMYIKKHFAYAVLDDLDATLVELPYEVMLKELIKIQKYIKVEFSS
jgi:serine protease inhibitor